MLQFPYQHWIGSSMWPLSWNLVYACFQIHSYQLCCLPNQVTCKKLHIHGASCENILTDLALSITESNPHRLWDKCWDVWSIYGTNTIPEKRPEVPTFPDLIWNQGVTHWQLDIGTVNFLQHKHIQDPMNTPMWAIIAAIYMYGNMRFVLGNCIHTPLKVFLEHVIW